MAVHQRHTSIILIYITLVVTVRKTSSFCEQSYVVICDNLHDYKINDTTTWRHIKIGSNQYKREPPTQVLDSSIMFNLQHTKSLTIIYRINAIRPISTLSKYYQLEHLNLYDNEIKSLEDETFHNIPKLREIYLDNNKIEFLGREIFKNTTLEIVSLQYNGLQSITTAFYGSKIEWIRLNNNKINYIKSGAFPKNLKRLELNHNLLETLNTLENLQNLQQLSVEHNRLKTLPDISSLMILEFLYLSYNDIKSINYNFEKHRKLGYIDLSSNKIYDELVADYFGSNTTPPIVLLAFNRLNKLQFKNPQMKKTDLVLYGNPWICDCLNKIEKVIADYGHDRTCELDCFKKGAVPVCIENGECGKYDVDEDDVEKFTDLVGKIDYKTRTACDIHF